jgi:hypothetical protein
MRRMLVIPGRTLRALLAGLALLAAPLAASAEPVRDVIPAPGVV